MPIPFPYRMIFLRHGETDWNVEGRLQGQRDIPLNPLGRDQAAGAGRIVRQWLGANALAVLAQTDFIASPLERTRQTMELARQATELPAHPYALDDRLKELSFGTWEGLTWPEVLARDPERARQRVSDKWGFVPPQGESYAMLAARLTPWLMSLSSDTLVVAHGGVARALMVLIGGTSADMAPVAEVHQGRPLIFEGGACMWLE